MSRSNVHDHSYEDYGRPEGEEFYNSVQRLISHFQTLDTSESPSQAGEFQRGRVTNKRGPVYYVDQDAQDIAQGQGGWPKLERSRSLGRLGEKERYRTKAERDYIGRERVGAYITMNDDVVAEEAGELRPNFVRGAGTRRTFSGVTRRNNLDTEDQFDDSRSDNYRLVSHSQYISSPIPESETTQKVITPRSSGRFIRNTPKTSSTRSIQKRSRSVPEEAMEDVQALDLRRNDVRSSMRKHKGQRQVEYVSTSGEKCFPFKKKKSHKSNHASFYHPVSRSAYSDYEDNYASEDSVFDTGYDSSASAGYTRQNHRLYGNPTVRRIDIRDGKYTSGLGDNYQAVEAASNVYSGGVGGQEPQIRLTKEGYKMLELAVNVSGFRPEDIQIVTQGKFLQVIAKGVVVKREEEGDSRIYRELKRQFTLPEVANAEYLQGILSPEGLLHITGPVGVSTNTKKLKRKRVKFHID